MEVPKIIQLDFSGCKHFLEIHLRIKDAFDFPDFYGCNWSAFSDLLWSEVDAERIEIYGESTLPDEWVEELQIMHKVLAREKAARNLNGERFDYVIIS